MHSGVCEAAAQHSGQSPLDLDLGGLRILVEERFGGQDHAVETETALGGLYLDERFL